MRSVKTLPAPQKQSAGTDQQTILNSLTKRWTVTLGKSAESIHETAAILSDAKAQITDRDTYVGWLKSVCKMSEATASKYQQINDCEWLHDEQTVKQLPPTWTIWYLLTQCKTKGQFTKAATFVSANAPSYKDLDDFIHTLLKKKPKKRLWRVGEGKEALVINKEDIDDALTDALDAAAEAKKETEKLKAELKVVKEDPSRAQIEETQTFDFDDESNVVKFEQFSAAYKKLQREKLERKIKAVLQAEGLSNVTVIVRHDAKALKVAA